MGGLEDGVYIITSLFAASLMLVCGYYIVTTLAGFPQFASTTATAVQENFTYLDGLIVFGMVLLFAGSAVLAYFLPTHPAFLFTWLLTAMMAFILAPIYSNLYASLAAQPLLTASFDTFPLTALVIGNLPIIALLINALIAIVSYGKRYAEPAQIQGL